VRLLPPVTVQPLMMDVPVGTAGRLTAKVTGADHGPHPAWHALTFSSYCAELCSQ